MRQNFVSPITSDIKLTHHFIKTASYQWSNMEVVRWYGAILKFQKENPPVMQQDSDPEYTSPPLNYRTKQK